MTKLTKLQRATIARIQLATRHVDGDPKFTIKASPDVEGDNKIEVQVSNVEGLRWFERHFFYMCFISPRGRITTQTGDIRI